MAASRVPTVTVSDDGTLYDLQRKCRQGNFFTLVDHERRQRRYPDLG